MTEICFKKSLFSPQTVSIAWKDFQRLCRLDLSETETLYVFRADSLPCDEWIFQRELENYMIDLENTCF